jgi:hypothetical protein
MAVPSQAGAGAGAGGHANRSDQSCHQGSRSCPDLEVFVCFGMSDVFERVCKSSRSRPHAGQTVMYFTPVVSNLIHTIFVTCQTFVMCVTGHGVLGQIDFLFCMHSASAIALSEKSHAHADIHVNFCVHTCICFIHSAH